MKTIYGLLIAALFQVDFAVAQTCPANGLTTISNYPNTYYASKNSISAGATTISLTAANYGTTPISSGDILLVIQMQGTQIDATNSSSYGDGTGVGSGYLNNTSLLAGNMEYVVATNNVALSGGKLKIKTGLVNSYKNSAFGSDGQYTAQVIRVPTYYDLQLSGTINPPRWDGSEGGVLVLYAEDNINLNSATLDASGRGFRGGGGRQLNGAGSGSNTDYITLSSSNANGSKGEGIAGTPYYVNDSDAVLYSTGSEGYPNGSYAMGAPGNAGGGATDGDPQSANDQNTGGGGGGNGGAGGNGGWGWSSATTSGGKSGALFAQASASRLVMGGGGGAGTSNDGTGSPGGGFASSGAAGGGIIIVMAGNTIYGTGAILANGAAGNATVQKDGAGGGGAGGSILIYSNNSSGTNNIIAQAAGGAGGINESAGGPAHGPGGGGGGGVIFSNGTLQSGSTVAGGAAGTTAGLSTNYGATSGSIGSMTTNMSQSAMAQFPLNCVVLFNNIIDLTAGLDNGEVTLNWTSSNPSDALNYFVERSSDGINFSTIGSTTITLRFADMGAAAVGGTLCYRIHQVQADGRSTYSSIVTVQLKSLPGKMTIYPNPARDLVNISFDADLPETVSLRLFDLRGSQMWSGQYEAQPGQNTVSIDRIRTLPEGIYMLQWSDGLTQKIQKIVVRH